MKLRIFSKLIYKYFYIPGLDPARVYYEGADPLVRLDESDAGFVDIIHSDKPRTRHVALGFATNTGKLNFQSVTIEQNLLSISSGLLWSKQDLSKIVSQEINFQLLTIEQKLLSIS